MSDLRHHTFNARHDASYMPKNIGEKESICIDCKLPKKKCNGDCKRYKELYKKLKGEKENGK